MAGSYLLRHIKFCRFLENKKPPEQSHWFSDVQAGLCLADQFDALDAEAVVTHAVCQVPEEEVDSLPEFMDLVFRFGILWNTDLAPVVRH